MVLRAVFLDVGGTLLQEVPSRYAIYAGAASRRGRPVEPGEMRGRMGAANRALPLWIDGAFRYSDPWFEAFIARIFGDCDGGLGFASTEVRAITAELFAHFESPETFVPYPGAHDLLRDLHAAGLVLGVVSNWSSRLPRVLEVTGLADGFDFVLSSAIAGVEKPDAELFRLALGRAGVRAEEALHAGDHPDLDVAGARTAGLSAVLVDHGGERGSSGETERVESLAQLGTLVLGRTR